MIRNAFKMKLKPGFEAEYKKRHDEIWPELSAALTEAGISDYSIFLDEETLTLFAVQKLAAGHTADLLPSHPIVKKWWAYMAPAPVVGIGGILAPGQLRAVAATGAAGGCVVRGLGNGPSATLGPWLDAWREGLALRGAEPPPAWPHPSLSRL